MTALLNQGEGGQQNENLLADEEDESSIQDILGDIFEGEEETNHEIHVLIEGLEDLDVEELKKAVERISRNLRELNRREEG